jgi:hypothetical protein
MATPAVVPTDDPVGKTLLTEFTNRCALVMEGCFVSFSLGLSIPFLSCLSTGNGEGKSTGLFFGMMLTSVAISLKFKS